MVKVLNDYWELRIGFMIMIYVYMGDQLIVDGLYCNGDFCCVRVGVINIVFNLIGVAKVIGLVIFELDGKLIGLVQ